MFIRKFKGQKSAAVFLLYCFSNFIICTLAIASPPGLSSNNQYETAQYWQGASYAELRNTLRVSPLVNKAKNAIFILGDGWDVETLTAARILKGQQVDHKRFGEEAKLFVESFPYSGLSKTYCADSQVADCACSATAINTGIKSRAGTIGLTPNVERGNCTAGNNPKNQLSSILAWAQAAGKCTAIVTTSSVVDASPAATYAHTANSNWQSDTDVNADGQNSDTCDDIAEQLILGETGKNIDVILGGGRVKFLPNTFLDVHGNRGQRSDGKNLIDAWKAGKAGKKALYVETDEQLANVDTRSTEALLGIFGPANIAYYHDLAASEDPSLELMTKKAIEICSKNPNGYYIMIEGARIDQAHQSNLAQRALWEAIEFDRAIQMADNLSNDKDTLIVATADHANVMTFAGYPTRGNDIMGIAGIADDNLPYATLNYDNGPGAVPPVNNMRYDISKDDLDSLDNVRRPMIPLKLETHGGQDVQILAKGPFAHLLTGIHEQNYIPIAMAYALCVGDGPTYCKDNGLPYNGWGAQGGFNLP